MENTKLCADKQVASIVNLLDTFGLSPKAGFDWNKLVEIMPHLLAIARILGLIDPERENGKVGAAPAPPTGSFIKRNPITFWDALKAARSIGPDTLNTMSRHDAAAMIAATALKAHAIEPGDPAIDWEGLITFIERLVPLILAIIEVFNK